MISITIVFLLISCSNVSDVNVQNHNAYKQIPLVSKQPTPTQSTIVNEQENNKQGIISTSTPSPDENIVDSHKSLSPETRNQNPAITTKRRLLGFMIGIDPGHQIKGNNQQEPIAPGSSITKDKVTSGTRGIKTKKYEYAVNLEVGLLFKKMLENEGARVSMTRQTNNVNISNKERAEVMNRIKADLVIRIHCNGSENSNSKGMFMLVPSTGAIATQSNIAARFILSETLKQTGARSMGIMPRKDMTGFNWSEVPVVLIEMGHMTNIQEDQNLSDSAYQQKLSTGMRDGVLQYFLKLRK